ncbi:MAG: SDR family oxidoreductase [Methylophilus sp.]|uniref:SDR family oxidoreductase n=1 Tax=Methylophilus sp. TaxID=29541 RepID=UPI003F9FD78B
MQQATPAHLRIVITGASSGIGQALAKAYARRYGAHCTLALLARNQQALTTLQQEITAAYGSQVHCHVADVRDVARMQAIAHTFLAEVGIPHVVIGNAGVSRGTLTEYQEDIAAFQAVFDTNVMGLVHTFQPFIAAMKAGAEQGEFAQLVGIASVAGIRGLPGSGAYSASKAAAITYLESLRVEMQLHHIGVTTISPGYIRTPMTDINTYAMPFLMEVDEFADKALLAIAKRKRYTVIPWQMGIVARLLRLFPAWLWDYMTKKAPHKARL